MKNFLILASLMFLVACAVNPSQTEESTRVVGSSSTNYTTIARIGCIDHLPREEAVHYRSHVEITKYEDRSWVCFRYEGDERCYEASVPYLTERDTWEIYSTNAGDTLALGVDSFRVTGGTGCFVLGR